MPVLPAKTVPIPDVSVPTYVFGSPSAPLSTEPIILDVDHPDSQFLSLDSYRRWSQCLAAGFVDAGLQAGDRVFFLAGNSVAYPVVYMAVLMAGGILSGSSAARTREEVINQASELEPTFILASDDSLAMAKDVAASISLASDCVYLFDYMTLFSNPSTPNDVPNGVPNGAPNGALNGNSEQRHWRDLLRADDPASFDWSARATPDQTAVIYYTSGSTGPAKGVMITHRNIVANAHQLIDQQHDDPLGPEHGHPMTWVSWIPMFQVFSSNTTCVICPRRGIRNYILRAFDLDALLHYTAHYRAHTMSLLPRQVIAMLSHPAVRARTHDLSSVRHAVVGGAPLRASVIARWEALMPHPDCAIVQAWGMTETTYIALNNPPTGRSRDASVGHLLPNISAKIMSLDGAAELPPQTPGELWIRGPNIAAGYWRRPAASAAAFQPGGWLRTGDLAHCDERVPPRWFVRDRVADVIARPGGALALPTDIEQRLLDVPGVLDAGVVGVPVADSDDGDAGGGTKKGGDGGGDRSEAGPRVPRAFVALDAAAGASVAGVLAAYNAGAAPEERLDGGLFALPALPHVRGAKINRAALRALRM